MTLCAFAALVHGTALHAQVIKEPSGKGIPAPIEYIGTPPAMAPAPVTAYTSDNGSGGPRAITVNLVGQTTLVASARETRWQVSADAGRTWANIAATPGREREWTIQMDQPGTFLLRPVATLASGSVSEGAPVTIRVNAAGSR